MVPPLDVFLYKILRIAATKFSSYRKWWPKLEVSDQYLISVQIENLQNREQVCLESLFCKESFFFFFLWLLLFTLKLHFWIQQQWVGAGESTAATKANQSWGSQGFLFVCCGTVASLLFCPSNSPTGECRIMSIRPGVSGPQPAQEFLWRWWCLGHSPWGCVVHGAAAPGNS